MTSVVSAQNYQVRGANDHVQYYYLDFSIDMDNAFNINKNNLEPRGLDYDAELGMRIGNIIPYVYYGEFAAYNMRDFGVGIDYVFDFQYSPIEIATGANIGGIHKKTTLYYGAAIRVKPTVKLNNFVSLYLKGQYQQRNDRANFGVLEVYSGIILKLY